MVRLMISTDGSSPSVQAFPLASEVALLSVKGLPKLESEDEAMPLVTESIQHRQLRETGEQALIGVANLLGLPGVSELLEGRHSDVATTIAQSAEEQLADLIVMASHGSSDLGRNMRSRAAERALSARTGWYRSSSEVAMRFIPQLKKQSWKQAVSRRRLANDGRGNGPHLVSYASLCRRRRIEL